MRRLITPGRGDGLGAVLGFSYCVVSGLFRFGQGFGVEIVLLPVELGKFIWNFVNIVVRWSIVEILSPVGVNVGICNDVLCLR